MKLLLFIIITLSGESQARIKKAQSIKNTLVCQHEYICSEEGHCYPRNALHQAGRDLVQLHRNLISKESLLVTAGILPLYLVSRSFDEDCHTLFYDRNTHKNIRQLPCALSAFESYSFAPLLVGLSVIPRFSSNSRVRLVSDVFAKGILSIWGIKNIIKNGIGTKACLRPWNEHFDRYKRTYGGFPSGHVAEAVYTAILMGLEYGPRAGVPLGIYTGLILFASVNKNRHYVSQVFAGAGIGMAYAFAAHKLIQTKLAYTIEINITSDRCGRPSVSFSTQF